MFLARPQRVLDARGWSENARNQTRGADFVRVPRLSVRRAHVLWLGCGEGVALLYFLCLAERLGRPGSPSVASYDKAAPVCLEEEHTPRSSFR